MFVFSKKRYNNKDTYSSKYQAYYKHVSNSMLNFILD